MAVDNKNNKIHGKTKKLPGYVYEGYYKKDGNIFIIIKCLNESDNHLKELGIKL